MSDLKYDLEHIQVDLTSIHDALNHLSEHADICEKLVKSSNIQEAMELFNHLDELDRLIHEVQDHVKNLDEGITADELEPDDTARNVRAID